MNCELLLLLCFVHKVKGKRYTVHGKPGGDFKIKNIIKYIRFDLFYFMSQMLEIHSTIVMHEIACMLEMLEMYFTVVLFKIAFYIGLCMF